MSGEILKEEAKIMARKRLINLVLIILSVLFVIFSFSPSLYEIYSRNKIPADREFVLEHNYMFDYNFYLSRIREGQEGRWTAVEKYYNQPHGGSLLQIFYLILGKMGGVFRLSPPLIYHLSRLLFGFILLFLIGRLCLKFFSGWFSVVAYLLVVTAGSFPILVRAGNFWRFGTHMGYWSVIDSLQRITFIPHILFGQIGLLVLIVVFGEDKTLKVQKSLESLIWGVFGFMIGIVFPPAVIVVYALLAIESVLELVWEREEWGRWFRQKGLKRIMFYVLSVPSLIYLNLILRVPPWSALSLFDIEHRIPIPYGEYFLALGPVLPLGIAGLMVAFLKKERKFYPYISWIAAVLLLFRIFENFPEQSPSRFTEAAIFIPLGLLSAYFFQRLLVFLPRVLSDILLRSHKNFFPASPAGGRIQKSLGLVVLKNFYSFPQNLSIRVTRLAVSVIYLIIIFIILMGLGVMLSMVGWLTDQGRNKREGTYLVPIGAEIIYPLKDFMGGIYFLRDNTDHNSVVLGYITSGNYIPAYAGNYVYIGHANTPDEDGKEKIAARFFGGGMSMEEARQFLTVNHVSYVYFGPQEREIGNISRLEFSYPFLSPIYSNNRVTVYKVTP